LITGQSIEVARMSRYLIIGCSGSGKSTLAKKISELTEVPAIETDKLYWGEAWNLETDNEVIKKLPLEDNQWILDGNFVENRDQVWSRATCITWIDPPFSLAMYRLVKRNLTWCLFITLSWTGGRMPFRVALSGILHAWRRHSVIQSEYSKFLSEYPDKATHRIRTADEYDSLLDSLAKSENEFA